MTAMQELLDATHSMAAGSSLAVSLKDNPEVEAPLIGLLNLAASVSTVSEHQGIPEMDRTSHTASHSDLSGVYPQYGSLYPSPGKRTRTQFEHGDATAAQSWYWHPQGQLFMMHSNAQYFPSVPMAAAYNPFLRGNSGVFTPTPYGLAQSFYPLVANGASSNISENTWDLRAQQPQVAHWNVRLATPIAELAPSEFDCTSQKALQEFGQKAVSPSTLSDEESVRRTGSIDGHSVTNLAHAGERGVCRNASPKNVAFAIVPHALGSSKPIVLRVRLASRLVTYEDLAAINSEGVEPEPATVDELDDRDAVSRRRLEEVEAATLVNMAQRHVRINARGEICRDWRSVARDLYLVHGLSINESKLANKYRNELIRLQRIYVALLGPEPESNYEAESGSAAAV